MWGCCIDAPVISRTFWSRFNLDQLAMLLGDDCKCATKSSKNVNQSKDSIYINKFHQQLSAAEHTRGQN
jgi:hypothetical protein